MTASKKTNITSIILLIATVLSALLLFIPSLMLAMVSDSCGSGCNMAVFTLGYYIAVFGTPLVAVTGIVFTIIKMVKKQDAVSYALIGLGGTYGAFMLGLAITFITASIK